MGSSLASSVASPLQHMLIEISSEWHSRRAGHQRLPGAHRRRAGAAVPRRLGEREPPPRPGFRAHARDQSAGRPQPGGAARRALRHHRLGAQDGYARAFRRTRQIPQRDDQGGRAAGGAAGVHSGIHAQVRRPGALLLPLAGAHRLVPLPRGGARVPYASNPPGPKGW